MEKQPKSGTLALADPRLWRHSTRPPFLAYSWSNTQKEAENDFPSLLAFRRTAACIFVNSAYELVEKQPKSGTRALADPRFWRHSTSSPTPCLFIFQHPPISEKMISPRY